MKNLASLIIFLCLYIGLANSPAHAVYYENGNFEKRTLEKFFVQEGLEDVNASPLVAAVNDGTGNYIGEIYTGFTSNGVYVASLGRDFGQLPESAQDLFFDFKFLDAGEDLGAPGVFKDALTISLFDKDGSFNRILSADLNDVQLEDPSLTSIETLSNGFHRVKTNVTGLKEAKQLNLYFDLHDEDDSRLSKVQIDNIDLETDSHSNTVPEPATSLLLTAGLAGLAWSRRKFKV